jgi:hypothetical protein
MIMLILLWGNPKTKECVECEAGITHRFTDSISGGLTWREGEGKVEKRRGERKALINLIFLLIVIQSYPTFIT